MPFARDPLSVAYDGQVARFFQESYPGWGLDIPAGGRFYGPVLIQSAGGAGDGIAGSDLTEYERAWTRSVYHYVNVTWPSFDYTDNRGRRRRRCTVSVRGPQWARRTPNGRAARFVIFPYSRGALASASYITDPSLRSDQRSERVMA